MPVVFEVHYTDGTSQTTKVIIEHNFQEVVFEQQSGKTVDYVLFDPNAQIPKKI
jgi:predicted peptidase